MEKEPVVPTCRYHDVQMVLYRVGGEPAVYMLPQIANRVLQLGKGYTVRLYECPKCSYVELHDYVMPA